MPKRQILQLAAIGALLIAGELFVAAVYAVAFVHPEYEASLKSFGFVLLIGMPVLVFTLGVVRLIQERYAYGVMLLVLSPIPFLMPNMTIISGPYWKFLLNKSAYLSTIQADHSAPSRFKIFDWGNRNIGLGGGVIYEAIVYDETGDVARRPDVRSHDWQKWTLSLPQHRWITSDSPECSRSADAFGDHFYFVVEVCT